MYLHSGLYDKTGVKSVQSECVLFFTIPTHSSYYANTCPPFLNVTCFVSHHAENVLSRLSQAMTFRLRSDTHVIKGWDKVTRMLCNKSGHVPERSHSITERSSIVHSLCPNETQATNFNQSKVLRMIKEVKHFRSAHLSFVEKWTKILKYCKLVNNT